MRRMRWAIPFMALVALLSFSIAAEARGVETVAQLTGSAAHPGVNGKAVYRVDSATDRKLQVEIEDARRLVGKTLIVLVNGKRFGTMTVDGLGNAQIEHETERGQAVPMIKAGSTVRVKTQAGVLVAKGTF